MNRSKDKDTVENSAPYCSKKYTKTLPRTDDKYIYIDISKDKDTVESSATYCSKKDCISLFC